jgi:hypothetical protein
MDEIARIDMLFHILHKEGWSIGDTAFVEKRGLTWPASGSKGEHSLRAEGKVRDEAWKQACRQAEEMG